MLLEPAGQKPEYQFDTHANRESKKKSRNMLVIGLIVSLLLVVICYIALSGDQKVIENKIPNDKKKEDIDTKPEPQDDKKEEKEEPEPVVDDDVQPLPRMKKVTTKASIDNQFVIINWQKPELSDGQTLQGYQVYVKGDDEQFHESASCKPLTSEVQCQILMTDLIKEPYNLQCGDHIAVQIKAHNGKWSEPSKPNEIGATIKVKPQSNGKQLQVGEGTNKNVLEITWKDESKKYKNSSPAFDCYPRYLNIQVSEDGGKTFHNQKFSVPETDEKLYIAMLGGKKIKADQKYVVHAQIYNGFGKTEFGDDLEITAGAN